MGKERVREGAKPSLSRRELVGDFASRLRDQERERIARELHDGVLQSLIALKLELESVLTKVQGVTAHHIQRSIEHLQSEIQEIRSIVETEIPDYLLDKTLDMAVETAVRRFSRYHPDVEIDVDNQITSDTDLEATWAVYRILQECLTNAAIHGQASKVTIALRAESGNVELSVADDGVGFAGGRAASRSGLNNMHWRAESLGGTVNVESQAGEGTTILTRIPSIRRRPPLRQNANPELK